VKNVIAKVGSKGAIAYALSNDNTIRESVTFACAAAISTTELGAQGAMPTVK
jgi:sugar/nucleoside kinase (ribokinase family)